MEHFFLAILVVLMASALISGFPVAFALSGSAIISILLAAGSGYLFAGDVDAFFAQGGPGQWLSAGVTNLRGIYWEPERDTLIAIPMFIFMGIMLQRSKIAEDLLITMAQLFGPIRGGLGISVVFVGALLAATTGIVGATVVAMGLISLPAMLRNGYSQSLATGTIAASGTLGQIIPPSIVLIILADQLSSAADQAGTARKALYKATTGELSMPSSFDVTSTSAGEMFLGAFVPGILLVLLYMVFILVFAFFNPKAAPAIPFEGKYDRSFAVKTLMALVPPLALILMVLGSIISGVATVNQAGAIGAAGALVMAGYRLYEGKPRAYWPVMLAIVSLAGIMFVLANFNTNIKNIKTAEDQLGVALAVIGSIGLVTALVWSGWRALKIENTLQGVMMETAKTTSLVFIILLGAALLTAAFRAFGGEDLVRDFLTSLPGGFWTQFVIVMAVIFFLGFFLDFIEIAVVVVPIVAPILLLDPGANVTAVWLGVMIGLNIQTSFLTPPFGFALFYLRGVAPKSVKTIQMYKGVVPFIGLQLFALVVVANYPALVNYLPNRVALTSETAPPPLNPRLQTCIEDFIFAEFEDNESQIRGAIDTAKKLDFSYLPKGMGKTTLASFDNAYDVFKRRDDIVKVKVDIAAATDAYRPLHREVRSLQKEMRKIDAELKLIKVESDRRKFQKISVADLDQLASEFLAARKSLESQIPANWKDENKKFAALVNIEKKSHRAFQRTSDEAYTAIAELMSVVRNADKLKVVSPQIEELATKIVGMDEKTSRKLIASVSKLLNPMGGAKETKKHLSKARRYLRGKKADLAKAQDALAKAVKAQQADVEWRERAQSDLLPGLKQYDLAIRDTIGLRLQPVLPRRQALSVAACNSVPRDISLSF